MEYEWRVVEISFSGNFPSQQPFGPTTLRLSNGEESIVCRFTYTPEHERSLRDLELHALRRAQKIAVKAFKQAIEIAKNMGPDEGLDNPAGKE
jgi:hypothetical protein